MTGFEKDCLKAHNEYRGKHGVPLLKWNAQLQADAQEWANHLASISKYVQSNLSRTVTLGTRVSRRYREAAVIGRNGCNVGCIALLQWWSA